MEDYDQANYGLGKRFGGNARKQLKGNSSRNVRRLSRKQLASVKGCWVCKKDHRARDHHSSEEILAALKQIKADRPTVLFTTDDVSEIEQALLASFADDGESGSESGSDLDEVNYLALDEDQLIGQKHEMYLSDTAFMHGRTFCTDLEKEMLAMHTALAAGEVSLFKGIIIDTGANRSSCMSLSQYRAYCSEFCVPVNIDYEDARGLIGIGGTSSSIGTATIPVPFQDLDLIIDVKFRILRSECPSLLSLRDMIRCGLDISIQEKTVSFKHKIQALTFENDFLKHKWSSRDLDFTMYTEKELRRLHRGFGHPSVSALYKLLKRANPAECDKAVQQAIEDISKSCGTCSKLASKPRRFKLSVGTEDLRFNHILAADLMYLSNKYVLHVVDEATHYSAATFVKSNSSEDTWKALLRCWSRVYLGPPDHLRVDQGSNFISKHFKDCVDAEGITLLEAPIESPNSMSHVERYHAPLRAAFNKIRDSLPRSDTDHDCLQMAIKAVNDTVGI